MHYLIGMALVMSMVSVVLVGAFPAAVFKARLFWRDASRAELPTRA